eukprot:5713596-Amphidinium_carterae.1
MVLTAEGNRCEFVHHDAFKQLRTVMESASMELNQTKCACCHLQHRCLPACVSQGMAGLLCPSPLPPLTWAQGVDV